MDKQSSTKTFNDVCKSVVKTTHALFLKALDHIGPLLQNGYILPCQISQSVYGSIRCHTCYHLQSRCKKKLLVDHHGDTIKFAMNTGRNESELVFSSHIAAADLATKIKNHETFSQVGEALNQC